ncbi:methyltransferase domain-containing protein [Pendulispora albinea]|uniref:Methyltransferase domain-containing protein n=1 Tax=Pendulispora albinea TaxID=2741071 RepID=A0ABZ2LLA5_9BACT
MHDAIANGAIERTDVAAAQRRSCLKWLGRTSDICDRVALSARERSKVEFMLHHLLQTVVAAGPYTLEDVPSHVIESWLSPCLGLSEHDRRLRLLEGLITLRDEPVRNPALRQKRQGGSHSWRALRDWLRWRWYHEEVAGRTHAFFEDLTQKDILDEEIALTPFYQALYQHTSGGHHVVFDDSDDEILALVQQLGITAPAPRVLDVGCGYGRLLKRFAQSSPGATLTGTSIFEFSSEQRTELAKHQITALYCAAERIEVPDCSQDIVLSTEVIEHLRRPAVLVREIHRVLRPGGIFCVSAPMKGASIYCPNPLTYAAVAAAPLVPKVLPRFHNLYAPLTPLRLVHYGMAVDEYRDLFREVFPDAQVKTTRFTALRKFRLEQMAPRLPLVRWMGGLGVAFGRKS